MRNAMRSYIIPMIMAQALARLVSYLRISESAGV